MNEELYKLMLEYFAVDKFIFSLNEDSKLILDAEMRRDSTYDKVTAHPDFIRYYETN